MKNNFADRQRDLLSQLEQEIAERNTNAQQALEQRHTRDEATIATYKSRRDEITHLFEEEIGGLRAEYGDRREKIVSDYEANTYAVVQKSEEFQQAATAEFEKKFGRAKRTWEVERRIATDEFNGSKDKPGKEYHIVKNCSTGTQGASTAGGRRGGGGARSA